MKGEIKLFLTAHACHIVVMNGLYFFLDDDFGCGCILLANTHFTPNCYQLAAGNPKPGCCEDKIVSRGSRRRRRESGILLMAYPNLSSGYASSCFAKEVVVEN